MTYLKLDEEHTYHHYNRALGCRVYGKDHYKKLMAEGGFIPYEQAQKIAAEARSRNSPKEYKTDPELLKFLNQIKLTADSKGNVKLGSRAIQRMKEFGVNFNQQLPDHLKNVPLEGGIHYA